MTWQFVILILGIVWAAVIFFIGLFFVTSVGSND